MIDFQIQNVLLDDGVTDLGGWDDTEGGHHAIGVLLTDLGDQKSSHTGTSAATKGVSELEALEAITALSLLADNIEDGVDKLGTFGVVTLHLNYKM